LGAALATQPCSVCGKAVHHICSNDIAPDPDDMSLRFCSRQCFVGGTDPGTPAETINQQAYAANGNNVIDLTGDSPLATKAFAIVSPFVMKVENVLPTRAVPDDVMNTPQPQNTFERTSASKPQSDAPPGITTTNANLALDTVNASKTQKRVYKVGSIMWHKQEDKKKRDAKSAGPICGR
jgi:hypothetical protein